jgi:hypothetical protein
LLKRESVNFVVRIIKEGFLIAWKTTTVALYFSILMIQNHLYRFLSVDAHALQHPEIHGRWSNHFHLTRLHLILHKKESWDYNKSPRLSDYLNRYKSNKSNEFLKAPEPLDRGIITAKDLTKVTTAEECAQLIIKWAEEVYHSWNSNHGTVSQIAEGFLANQKW